MALQDFIRPGTCALADGATITIGSLHVRLSCTEDDIQAAQRLRGHCFNSAGVADTDPFDIKTQHVFVECADTDAALACFRFLLLDPNDIANSYAHQFYDLSALACFQGRLLEIGRFCSVTTQIRPDVLRMAWGAIAAIVDAADVRLLFGCSSFAGTSIDPYKSGFRVLNEHHLAPPDWRPGIKADEFVRFGDVLPCANDHRHGWGHLPPLLRSYLAMGGWVSDHAVIDRNLNTLHVLTGVEVAKIPETRKRQMRSILEGQIFRDANQVDVSKTVDAQRPRA